LWHPAETGNFSVTRDLECAESFSPVFALALRSLVVKRDSNQLQAPDTGLTANVALANRSRRTSTPNLGARRSA
jgi:hypothetical protein